MVEETDRLAALPTLLAVVSLIYVSANGYFQAVAIKVENQKHDLEAEVREVSRRKQELEAETKEIAQRKKELEE